MSPSLELLPNPLLGMGPSIKLRFAFTESQCQWCLVLCSHWRMRMWTWVSPAMTVMMSRGARRPSSNRGLLPLPRALAAHLAVHTSAAYSFSTGQLWPPSQQLLTLRRPLGMAVPALHSGKTR